MIAVSCPKIIIKRLSGQLIPFSVLAEPAVRASDEIIRFLSGRNLLSGLRTKLSVFCLGAPVVRTSGQNMPYFVRNGVGRKPTKVRKQP